MTCGKCQSENVYSGSWTPSKCRDCGAVEGPDDWYYEDETKEDTE